MPLSAKDVLKGFKAHVDRPQNLAALVQEADPLEAGELTKIYDFVVHRRLVDFRDRHQQAIAAFSTLVEQNPDKALFRVFMRGLKSESERVRAMSVALMPGVNQIRDHGDLCQLMRNQDPRVRTAAAGVLAKVGGRAAFHALHEMCGEGSFRGRIQAMDALAEMAGHHVIPVMQTVMRVGVSEEKSHSLSILGTERYMRADRQGALDTIVMAFEDRSANVVLQAVRSFGRFCDEEGYHEHLEPFLDKKHFDIAVAALQPLARFAGRRTMQVLERKLREGPNKLRFASLDVLRSIGNDSVLPVLMVGMSFRHVAVRKHAADVLVNLAAERKIDVARAIIWLLRSRDVNLRRMSADLVNRVEDPDNTLWPKLVSFLRDEDWWVRERVMDALVVMAGRKLTRYVVAYLKDPNDVVRRFFVEVLRRLEDPASLGALVRLARDDPDWWVRERSVEAMAAVGDPRAVPYVVDLLGRDPELQYVCIEAIMTLEARDSLRQVVPLLRSDDEDIRNIALDCVAKLGDRGLGQMLMGYTKDPDRKFRARVTEVLIRWGYSVDGETTETGGSASFLDRVLAAVARAKGDDLLLMPGRRPCMKRMGEVRPVIHREVSDEQIRALVRPLLTTAQLQELSDLEEVDLSYTVDGSDHRFRANLFFQRGGLSAVFRTIQGTMPKFEDLGLPEHVRDFADMKNGIVLVGGPTGSGKSTTLAALIDFINRESPRHIISLEDPIEYVHPSKKGLVNQREIGTHAPTFEAALRSTLRQDPDVILVGEMRDLPTIQFAVTAAETGHLVFGTVHTVSADTTVDRLVNAFPPQKQDQVRVMLAESLRAVVCQYLLPRRDAPGRALAAEILINTDAVANLIRRDSAYQLPSLMSTSREQGMQTMDQELMRLLKLGAISPEDAFLKARNKKEFEGFLAPDSVLAGGDDAVVSEHQEAMMEMARSQKESAAMAEISAKTGAQVGGQAARTGGSVGARR